MSWTLLIGLAIALTVAFLALAFRRSELLRLEEHVEELATARQRGTRRARLQYPHIDLSRCMGCGTCAKVCPEGEVLRLIHGQAIVVHGARCVGHGTCADECPTGAIVLTFADLESRRDLPVLNEEFEVPEAPGLFLGGEVTGFALIRTAIAHGTAIADEVTRRTDFDRDDGVLDLLVIGAGPAGLACALQSKKNGISCRVIEQETLGGTVSKYPRRKLVMVQPVELPLHGVLNRPTYYKEELIEIWGEVAAQHELDICTGVRFTGVARYEDGTFRVDTDQGAVRARHVALMLGRRGTPRKLGIPGEELPKVTYSLIDAQSYENRRVLVVGGGDSAVEAALALAEQEGNEVTLSYRSAAFSRIKAKNEERLQEAVAEERVAVVLNSQLESIAQDHVVLRVKNEDGDTRHSLPNDEVFVLAGGIPPFELLQQCGVSFDPTRRAVAPPPVEQGTGLIRALGSALALTVMTVGWLLFNSHYYMKPPDLRPLETGHSWLKPSGTLGLALGVGAVVLVLVNLAYLLRRYNWMGFRWGTLKTWMTSHIVTGVFALLCALVHGAMAPMDTLGTRALWAMAVLVASGGIGRYLYSFVPRAANGRELELDELRGDLSKIAGELERENRDFGEHVRDEIQALVSRSDGQRTLPQRLGGLIGASGRLRRLLRRLRTEGLERGLAPDQIDRLLSIARRAHRTASMASHFEDARAVVGTWRWLHRWSAAFLVLVVAIHILVAIRYGGVFS
jgi:thioredoxin reductase/Pyruvate/2-oxoacid:ferredoxin oxidoreductase delta subunit